MANGTAKGKLVRDNIPAIIRKKGEKPKFRRLKFTERVTHLCAKLVEESKELRAASRRSDILEELADVREVYDALLRELHFCDQEVARKQLRKRLERGGFTKCYYLEG